MELYIQIEIGFKLNSCKSTIYTVSTLSADVLGNGKKSVDSGASTANIMFRVLYRQQEHSLVNVPLGLPQL